MADSIEWILRRRGVVHIAHYLDDFIILGTPHSSQCADSLKIVVDTCAELGVPLALDKCEGPRTRLTFLGIELHGYRDVEPPVAKRQADQDSGHPGHMA